MTLSDVAIRRPVFTAMMSVAQLDAERSSAPRGTIAGPDPARRG